MRGMKITGPMLLVGSLDTLAISSLKAQETPYDQIDNDGDGIVDESRNNGIDDDGDWDPSKHDVGVDGLPNTGRFW